jgi:hypothetical protein
MASSTRSRNGRLSSTGNASTTRAIVQRRPGTGKRKPVGPFDEAGTSGLKQFSGWIYDDILGQLHGRQAAWAYREFMDNDAIAGGFIFALEMLARRVTWGVEDGKSEHQQFLYECMHDMSHPWENLVTEALSMVGYGYANHEIVLKRRQGNKPRALAEDTPASEEDTSRQPASSKYKDGKIGWRKIPLRAQESTLHFEFDGYSGLAGMVQLDWHGGEHFIPIEKSVLFRTRVLRGNPEGYSLLRKAWPSFFRARNLQEIEATGAERDLAGIPVLTPPPGVDLFSPQHSDLYNRVQEVVTTIKRDEDEGVVLPSDGWKLELLSSPGSRQFDTDKVIRRYEQRIAASVLADFMLLGQDGAGSYAMTDIKSEFFGMAVDAILDLVCEPMNRYAIPRLFALNGITDTELPKITHTTAGRIDLEKIGSFLYNFSAAGGPIPWNAPMVKELFSEAGLPVSMGDAEGALDASDKLEAAKIKADQERQQLGQAVQSETKPGGGPSPATEDQKAPATPEKVEKAQALTSDVRHCARCGLDHEGLAFTPLDKPMAGDDASESYTHWAGCPNTGEPIMLGQTDIEKAEGEEETEAESTEREAKELAALAAPVTVPVAGYGTAILIGPQLAAASTALAVQLEREIVMALGLLGIAAATAFLLVATPEKLKTAQGRRELLAATMGKLGLKAWFTKTLEPILGNAAARTAGDTRRLISRNLAQDVPMPHEAVRRMQRDAGAHLRLKPDLEPQVKDAIETVLNEAFAQGQNPDATARMIREMVPAGRFVHAGSKYRARLISRTETADLQRASLLAAYKAMPNVTAIMLSDGIYGPPRSDQFCVTGDTIVAALDPEKGFSRHYEGDIVRVRTRRGYLLSVTPEHSILTDGGWVTAGLLRKGDKVASYLDPDRMAHDTVVGRGPYDGDMPTTTEEQSDLLSVATTHLSVAESGGTRNLDGEGFDGNVDVVALKRSLRDRLLSEFGEQATERLLFGRAETTAPLAATSEFVHVGVGSQLATDCRVSSVLTSAASFRSVSSVVETPSLGQAAKNVARSMEAVLHMRTRDTQPAGDLGGTQTALIESPDCGDVKRLGEASTLDAVLAKHVQNGALADADGGRDLYGTLTGLVPAHDISGVERRSLRAQRDLILAQASPHDLDADPQAERDLAHALAGFIAPDEVVDVEIEAWCGHVYNLQTAERWFVANGIVAHNCIGRDGEIVPIDDVDSAVSAHVGCTLSYSPVVADYSPVPA